MQLSRTEFYQAYNKGTLRLAFVGMSNIGKSYTAKRLAKSHDFTLIEVDRLIWERLDQGSMRDFAKWQGHPYTDGYQERETKSLAMETEATRQALGLNLVGNTLLDTTGSVIYVEPDVLETLTDDWIIVHIKAEDGDLERLRQEYFQTPKPLIWHGHYKRDPDQSEKDSILASYPKLLNARKKRYEDLADVSLTSRFVLQSTTTPDRIFDEIRAQLKR